MRTNINSARKQVAALRLALISASPEPIEECLPRLVEAGAHLGLVEQALRTGRVSDPDLILELNALKGELRAAGKLVAFGLAFYQGWGRLLASSTAGYTPAGEAAPLVASGTVSVRG
jgi:hypothetical protein